MNDNANTSWGPLQGGLMFLFFGGWLYWLISGDSPIKKTKTKVTEVSPPIDWTPLYDFLEFILVVGFIALGTWCIYKTYLLFRKAILSPIRLSQQKISQLEKDIKTLNIKNGNLRCKVDEMGPETSDRLNKQKGFILGISKFTGYDGYIASQKAIQDMVGAEGDHHE